jgi:hypothetical protein
MANLFAFRSTDPRRLRQLQDPIGPSNDEWLIRLKDESEMAVAAWGNQGNLYDRGRLVAAMLTDLHCLGWTKIGAPRHPLYVHGCAKPLRWTLTPALTHLPQSAPRA